MNKRICKTIAVLFLACALLSAAAGCAARPGESGGAAQRRPAEDAVSGEASEPADPDGEESSGQRESEPEEPETPEEEPVPGNFMGRTTQDVMETFGEAYTEGEDNAPFLAYTTPAGASLKFYYGSQKNADRVQYIAVSGAGQVTDAISIGMTAEEVTQACGGELAYSFDENTPNERYAECGLRGLDCAVYMHFTDEGLLEKADIKASNIA